MKTYFFLRPLRAPRASPPTRFVGIIGDCSGVASQRSDRQILMPDRAVESLDWQNAACLGGRATPPVP